jgi:hypothetical protein
MKLSPIILFVYDRPWHTEQTIETLQNNELADQSELYIFSDGPKDYESKLKVGQVRAYIKTIKGFKKVIIIERQLNYGLARSVISGVTEIIDNYGKVIVLEDDSLTSKYFLGYMNKALNIYKIERRVFSVAGYNFPINIPKRYKYDAYFAYRGCSWGWGTWRDRWVKTDWEITDYGVFKSDKRSKKMFNRGGDDLSIMLDMQIKGEIDSWAIRWFYAHYKNNALCLYPIKSLVKNIGFDGSGIHCGESKKYEVELSWEEDYEGMRFPSEIIVDNALINIVNGIHKNNMEIRIKLGIMQLLHKIKGIIMANN